ncbi:hypothetical protein CTEN210_00960 [Chaetoceros tenuissimus]|uniref:Kringle domain-containing protein n=1 Tax=Chaetoceros tenuissimus TaxID=426638 RepID=A0AAD3CES6_9STRA|nr:hypothetical protein CTEN210_00960 [Chaetoceros tenuissimus]
MDEKYYLEGDTESTAFIKFQYDKNVVSYFSGCGAISSTRTNSGNNAKAFFTKEGRIVVKYYNGDTEISEKVFPEDGSIGLNEKKELCRLRYFDGQVVCMFPDGKIAYTLQAGNHHNEKSQQCARARSFKIPGYTNPDTSLGKSIPQSCAGNGSSCHVRVCGVDTLKIPANIDVSKFAILNDSGKSLRRTWHRKDDFFEYELMSTAFGGRSVFPTTPFPIQIDTYESPGTRESSGRRLSLESSDYEMSNSDSKMNDNVSLVDVAEGSEEKVVLSSNIRQDEQFEKSSDGNRRLAAYSTWSENSIKPGTWIEPGRKYFIGGAGTLEQEKWKQPWIWLREWGVFEAWHDFKEDKNTKLFSFDFTSLKTGCNALEKGWGGYLQSDRHLIFACKKNGSNELDKDDGNWNGGLKFDQYKFGPTYELGSSCALVYLNRKVVCMDLNGQVFYSIGDGVSGFVDKQIRYQELPYQVKRTTAASCPMNFEVEYGDCVHAVRKHTDTMLVPYNKYCTLDDKQRDYRGNISQAGPDLISYCQKWYFHISNPTSCGLVKENCLKENYCRNPDNSEKAWCYTWDYDDDGNSKKFCNVPRCTDSNYLDMKVISKDDPEASKYPEKCSFRRNSDGFVQAVFNFGSPSEAKINLLCKKPRPIYEIDYLEQTSQCETGLDIEKQDCFYAGLESLAMQNIEYNHGLFESNSDDKPCGCYYLGGKIYFGTGTCGTNPNAKFCRRPVKYIMPNMDPLLCLGRDSSSDPLKVLNCESNSFNPQWFYQKQSTTSEYIAIYYRAHIADQKQCLNGSPNLSLEPKESNSKCDFEWEFLQDGQIRHKGSNSVIELGSDNSSLSLQEKNDFKANQKWFVSDRRVKKESKVVNAHFKGSYQNGIFFQDHTGFARVQNEEVHLYGNSWKLFEFVGRGVHFRTKLQFKYKIFETAEDHFICFGTNYNYHVSKEVKRNCVNLEDSQLGSNYQVGSDNNDWATVSIPIFDFLKEESLTPKIDYIAFIQNNDADPLDGHSAFSDFRIGTIELGTPSFSCGDNFIAADNEGMRPTKNLNTDTDFCVSSNLKSLVSHKERDETTYVEFATRGYSLDSLELYEAPDLTVKVEGKTTIDEEKVSFDVATKDYAGKKFHVVQTNDTNDAGNPFQFQFITKCSGEVYEDTNDLTGAPRNFVSYQEKGHVRFRFMDNSLCEDGFAFTRFDNPSEKEFLNKEFFDEGVTFSPIFYFSGKDDSGEDITPETEASDDLTLSTLTVGEEYGYCIRAVHRERYMDTMGLDRSDDVIDTKSSSSTCHVHRIRWESSISGKVTTEPNAGTLPIKHVRIDYELMTEMQEPIDCDGCSGTVYTDPGGSFNIDFNLDHPLLKGKGSESMPVRLKYSKVTKFGENTIKHIFLCNNGLEFCKEEGNLVYLKHLHFEEPIHLYDDTSVPFRGKIFYHNTRFPGTEGCPIVDAEVCLVHHTTANADSSSLTKYDLVCVKSNTLGEYNAPIIMGSEVHEVDVRYHGHKFGKSLHNRWNYTEGIIIGDSEVYSGHDFMDISKATLRVEVVGGDCSKPLGDSKVNVKIEGCDWHGHSFEYSGIRKEYNVPPTLVKVQVTSNEYPHIESYFQNGDSPRTESIDLTDEHILEDEIENRQDADDEEVSDEPSFAPTLSSAPTASSERDQQAEAKKTEEDQISLVRFQYDGTLAMDVQITSGVEDISACDSSTFISNIRTEYGADSFHVTTKGNKVNFKVMLKFDLIKTAEQNISCDIVGDDYTVTMMNNIGGSCSDGCTLQVNHDEEDGTKTGGARAEIEKDNEDDIANQITVGEPNIISPYTKNIFFQVSGNGASVSHNAHFFIQGIVQGGEGKSFALPNAQPVMILRDPPGGLSYAKFENVHTSMKLVKGSTTVSKKTGLEYENLMATKQVSSSCAGIGASLCKDILDLNMRAGLHYEGSLGGNVKDYEEEKSNSYSTTWSYTTSTSPDIAGRMSDIFVVPNIFVEVTTYTIVAWLLPEEKCKPYEVEEGKLPTYTDFDINSEETALAFFSRHHIVNVKVPELQAAREDKVKEKERMKNDNGVFNVVCCNEPPCFENSPNLRTCDLTDWSKVVEEVNGLDDAINDWNDTLNIEADIADINEFFGSKNPFIYEINDEGGRLSIDNHPSGLVPPFYEKAPCGYDNVNGICAKECHLCEDGKCIDHTETESGECPASVMERRAFLQTGANTNRMQFSGGGGVFEMTMNNEYSSSKSGLSSWHLPNVEFESKLQLKLLEEPKFMGVGFEHEAKPVLKHLHVVHTSHKGDSVQRVEMKNLGEAEGNFQLEAEQKDEKYLTIVVDGTEVTEAGIPFTLEKRDKKRKIVALYRNPFSYHYNPVELTINTCDASSETISLSNDFDSNQNETIVFLQPCPTIKWSGDLQRDREFVLNLQAPELLPVEIFNNERIGGTLKATKEERRLEAVQLKYRRLGDVNWSDAYKSTADSDKMDFLETLEDDYGYMSLEWDTESLADATYEIMVESQCQLVNGGPELSRFREEIIVGVKDKIAPKQYGKALPLKDDILFGEEMTVLFSEKIDCSFPFKFDVTLEIQDFYDSTTSESCVDGNEFCHLRLKKSNNDLQISCEGRKIGLIPDFSVLGDVEKFLGKSFHVEVGNEGGGSLSHVFDVNGNRLKHNVEFDKSFLALDLYTITAKIDVTIDSCPAWVTSEMESEKTAELASILGLSDSSRIKITDQRCSGGKAQFRLLITPPSTNNGRYLRNLFQKDSMSDLDSLKFLSKLREMNNHRIVNGRYLQEDSHQVKITLVEIIPGEQDRLRLETPVELLREERHLQNIMSFEGDIHHIRENDLPDDIVRNSNEEQSQIELLLLEQQKKMDAMREEDTRKMKKIETLEEKMEELRMEDAEMRKEDNRKMEEMRKEDARALKEMQQKEHEEIKEVFMASIAIIVGTILMVGGAMFIYFRRS